MIVKQLEHLAVSIDQLHHDPSNARKHGQKNLEAIKASLHKFGQRKPIIVQKDGMVVRAGNGTLAAAKELGWKQIAAVVLDDDNATASQFAIADNRTAELAEWDEDILKFELDRFPDLRQMWEFDLESDDIEQDVVDVDVKASGTVWLVSLMPDMHTAEKTKLELERSGAKVALGARRQ
jgi:hypothetical protein